jgi:hypothetical protein
VFQPGALGQMLTGQIHQMLTEPPSRSANPLQLLVRVRAACVLGSVRRKLTASATSRVQLRRE